MVDQARPARRQPRSGAVLLIVALTCLGLAAYPFISDSARQAVFVGFACAVVVPVAVGYRDSPAALRVPWRLLLAAMVVGAITNLLRRVPGVNPDLAIWAGWAGPVVASLLLLGAALGVVLQRGRNDYGGLIDASLAGFTLGGLLWNFEVFPRLAEVAEDSVIVVALAALMLILSAIIGALIRLIETDTTANRSLRLLLAAVALNLAGFILVGGWPNSPGTAAGMMLFIAAYAALALSAIDPSVVSLTDAGPPRPDRLGAVRLTFLALALLAAPLVAGVRLIQGRPANGAVLIVASAILVLLVMLRVGLLAQQLHRSQAALRHMATHDPLTGVLNRRGFTDQLAAELKSPRDLALIFSDLNEFKQVNDAHGHAVGDGLLTEVARRLRRCVRQTDSVCRLGGDEFVILLRGAGTAQVAQVRQRIAEALLPRFHFAGGTAAVTASVGSIVSHADERQGVTAELLIEQADAAMYVDKASAAPNRRADDAVTPVAQIAGDAT